jgi:orotidine-5'-phosphate decarboxylase
MSPQSHLIVALDVDSLEQALPLVEKLSPHVGLFKVGLELLTAEGAPQVVRRMHDAGGKLFFDGKFDDIPNTVAKASRATSRLGVAMFDVHASAGEAAIRAAAENKGGSKLLAVTVLTSLDDAASRALFGDSAEHKVPQFARLAVAAGADGVVCSPRELELLTGLPPNTLKVTPGVRPKWAESGDQKRTLTPREAIEAGATHLVVGRPILQPPSSVGSPVEAAKRITEEIAEGLR